MFVEAVDTRGPPQPHGKGELPWRSPAECNLIKSLLEATRLQLGLINSWEHVGGRLTMCVGE